MEIKIRQREFAPRLRAPRRLFLVISESNGSIQALHQEIQLEIGAMIKAEKTSFSNAKVVLAIQISLPNMRH